MSNAATQSAPANDTALSADATRRARLDAWEQSEQGQLFDP